MEDIMMPHETLSEQTIQLLKQRAEQLVDVKDHSKTISLALKDTENVYLCFYLMDELYGLPLNSVREVIALSNIVWVPRTPEHVAGLIRLRGKILALIDLRSFWHGSTKGHADSDWAIVIKEGDVEMGIICTAVRDLIEVVQEEVKEIPKNIPTRLASSLIGITQREIKLISPFYLISQPGFLVRQEKIEE